ncbi:hypothetical protein CTI12_AA263100 [Artemisia annua]|uniref:LOB domain-containing protein n=1 Tax=Artemisia annua TaxID=35608 RepID=A0A2U1NI37_ARTAN|nr:hypothetical protein CTI12_AA263100 [Artemisia annua]
MRHRGIACAVCNFQRKKCPQDCILEPYFPQDHPQQFQNAHNLFGVKNMLKTLQNLDDQEKKDEAMRNMIYEANVRAKDPVGGCYRIVLELEKQIKMAKRELACSILITRMLY